MRTLDALLTAEQKKSSYKALVKAVFAWGAMSYTYTKTQIMYLKHTETPSSFTAEIQLDNAAGTFTALDLRGYKCTISWGMLIGGVDYYSACAPLWVRTQRNTSVEGHLITLIECEGIPNFLQNEYANCEGVDVEDMEHTYGSSAHVDDIFTSILSGSGTDNPFYTCDAYDVDYDSTDALLTGFCPDTLFNVPDDANRWDKLVDLMNMTTCVFRPEDDGDIHVFVPTISGASYDYSYALSTNEHHFFMKSYHTRLVTPNAVYVSGPRDAAEPIPFGYAEDEDGYNAKPSIRKFEYNITTDEQAELIAIAMLAHAQINSQSGTFRSPLNCGQELYDYIAVVDSRDGTTRAGNVEYIFREYNAAALTCEQTVGFGTYSSTYWPSLFPDDTGGDGGDSTGGHKQIYQMLRQLAQLLLATTSRLDTYIKAMARSITTMFLTVTRRIIIPHGLDASKETNPKAGSLYEATDTGLLYTCYTDGTWTPATGKTILFAIEGTLVQGTNSSFAIPIPQGCPDVFRVRLMALTAPTGADIIVDVNIAGVSIFSTQSNRPTIAAGATTGVSGTPDIRYMPAAQALTVDIDQVGSSVAGADLVIAVECA
jgi:hypothetical protein